jgi:4-azaleucine resistance transporter AzlC
MTTKTQNLSLKSSTHDDVSSPDDAVPHNKPISTPMSEFWAGVKTIAPILLGVLPFATIIGITVVEMELPVLMAPAMSLIMLAGTAQLAMLQLLKENTPIIVILLTAIVINLRFAMYSASMVPHFKHLPQQWKAFLAYFLTDQAFAISITRFNDDQRHPHKHWYFLGAGLAMCLLWVLGTPAGALLGAFIPTNWSLDFAIPLMFIGLVVPAIKSRAAIAAALTSGVVVVIAANIPFNLDLIVAAVAGIVVGVIIQERQKGGK